MKVTNENNCLRHELILSAENLLDIMKKYNESKGNPFEEMIVSIEKGLNLILFSKEKYESDN